ncbi:alpha/beta hydrolase [Streptomyces sp. NBC_00239]|uniref:alpha/beta hydrolase n=1 Tax=Streptomyces sp. NBC_00239 TaxID=2903640 RepID=UPI002E29F54E|nr:alpha/beta fold hydrolase [Streptomyces sp. NBC_00239]
MSAPTIAPVVAPSMSPGVRPVTLDAGDITLSALIAQPAGPPRATIVAVHGGGMSAGYFDGQAHPDVSLLTLGARLGYTVVSVDRPGYGLSAARLPRGQSLAEQSATLTAALTHLAGRFPTGAGLFLVAHSFGGKLALTYAADRARPRGAGVNGVNAVNAPAAPPLLGLDINGCGRDYAVDPGDHRDPHVHSHWKRNWGALRFYPPNTFRDAAALVAPMPVRERAEAARWPESFTTAAAAVTVPVRLTFAEHELWWRHGEDDLDGLAGLFGAAPFVTVDRQPDAGHNISLGWVARSYHLRALAFLEECLARAGAAG